MHYNLLGRDTAVKLAAVRNVMPFIWSSSCTDVTSTTGNNNILHRKYFQIGACIHGL